MTDEELQHLLTLRAAYIARIQLLEERQARRGELPSGEALELNQAQRDLEGIEARLQTVPVSREARQAIGPHAQIIILEFRVKALEDKLHDGLLSLERKLTEMQGEGQERRRVLMQSLIVIVVLLLSGFVALVVAGK